MNDGHILSWAAPALVSHAKGIRGWPVPNRSMACTWPRNRRRQAGSWRKPRTSRSAERRVVLSAAATDQRRAALPCVASYCAKSVHGVGRSPNSSTLAMQPVQPPIVLEPWPHQPLLSQLAVTVRRWRLKRRSAAGGSMAVR